MKLIFSGLVILILSCSLFLYFSVKKKKYTVYFSNQSSQLIKQVVVSGVISDSVETISPKSIYKWKYRLPDSRTHQDEIRFSFVFDNGEELDVSDEILSNFREIKLIIHNDRVDKRTLTQGYL